MANFITTSATWTGKQNLEYFLRPMFIGPEPANTQGVRVIPNVQSAQLLNYFGVAKKLLKKYVKGFNAVAGAAHTQRTITVTRMKAESAEDGLQFYQTVFEQGLKKGDWNDLTDTDLKEIIISLYRNAVASDVFRQFWLNDTNKETVSSGVITGTADTDYNAFQGMWSLLMANAATSPSDTQIKRITVSDGAVSGVNTVTLTGTAGTANVTVGGVAYLATFDTDLDTTHANFVALHATALALRGITLTGTTTIIMTSAIPGQPIPTPTVTNLTSNLAGSNAATTANTAPSALAAGESEDIFLSLFVGAKPVLKHYPSKDKVFLVTDLVLENYMTYLESLGTERSHILLEDGKEFYTYRGIKIIAPGWDADFEADFPHATGELYAYPHRVIYTTKDNLVLGLDALSSYNETQMWYNKDEEENRFRTKLVMGCQYVHNELVAVAY
jgi:hypothetical protein